MLDTYRQDYTGSLTDEQIRFYDIEGYLVLEDFLDEADLQPVKDAMSEKVDEIADALYADGLVEDKLEDSPFETRLAELFAGKPDSDFLRFGRGWRDRKPGYYEVMANKKILDAVESLIGGEIYANPVYNTRPKLPHVAAGEVPWHQDKSYWPDANANPVITVWFSLVDATEENGCLHIMPRTHRQKLMSFHKEDYSSTGYLELDEEHMTHIQQSTQKQAIPLPMKAGDIVLFNDRCIHKSTPNVSDHIRWSLDLRYQPTDQDPMPRHGIGFLARSYQYPERVATLADWLALREERMKNEK
ncbi:MAG: phytanoyl-CoA dioxygenase family protein [Chloroflexota bacterium]